MTKIRLVRANLGRGGCDFYRIETRTIWWPFWILHSWDINREPVVDKYNRMLKEEMAEHPKAFSVVLDQH